MATQPPGTRLTIIAGALRGRRCVHQADVFDKPISCPFPEHAFRVWLVDDQDMPEESIVVGCHQVKVGWQAGQDL